MDHRGRHQAQGHDVHGGNCSENWAQSEPYPAAAAHTDLSSVEARLTQAARELRALSFRLARRFICNAHAAGGVGPTTGRFPVRRQDEVPDARVEIEVKKGKAFT